MTMFVQTLTLITLVMVDLSVSLPNDDSTMSEIIKYQDDISNRHTDQPETGNAPPCPNNPKCSCSETIKQNRLKVDCSFTNMTKIPENFPKNTATLILAKNYISEIPDKIFRRYSKMTSLDLSSNLISELGSESFIGLQNLKGLNLHMNKLRYTNLSILNDTFRPLKKLTSLYLQQNLSDFWENESYPIQAMKLLTNLTKLSLDGMENREFDSDFKAIPLETLNLRGRCRGKIGWITKDMFRNLPKLKKLCLKNCSIDFVQNGSFIELPNLEKLDLSFNENLEFKSMSNITYGLQFTQIAWLNLNNIHQVLGGCTKLTVENLKYLYKTSVKYVYLDNNRLETMDTDAVDYIPASLKNISVRYNRLAFGKFIKRLVYYICKKRFDNLTAIYLASQRLPDRITDLFKSTLFMQKLYPGKKSKISKRSLHELKLLPVNRNETGNINLLGNPVKSSSNYTIKLNNEENVYQRYFEERCGDCPNSSFKLPIPSNLNYLDLHDMRIRTELQQFCICENNVETLRCDKNMIWNWKGKLLGFNRLKNLSLANNACSRIAYDFFDNMTSLVKLNISKNFLGTPLSKDYDGRIFKKLANLETLSISYNRIKQLSYNFFQGLTGLRELILTGNQIVIVDWNIEHMVNLSYVNLADNFIAEINETVREHWDRLATKGHFWVNLARNNFKCTCKNLDLIKWFSETNVHFTDYKTYTCKFDNGSVGNLTFVSEIYRSLESECASYMTIILATSAAVLIGICIIAAGIVYRYRWNLRYLYYSAKFRLRGYIPVNHYEGEFEHDAFISYASEDGSFIRQFLVPELENNRGLKLLVHDRDFVAGNFVNDNIMRAVTTCSKTLIIMSPHFLHSRWCCYEMNMARMEAIKTDRDVICILMKDHVQTSGLPLEVLDIIQKQTYMEYPTENPQLVQQFWDRVADGLRQN